MKAHGYRVGANEEWYDDADVPTEDGPLESFITTTRRHIEPWLSAVFQSEHLNLLLGAGFTTAVGVIAGAPTTTMATLALETPHDAAIEAHARTSAARLGRGEPNMEDQVRSALALMEGLVITGDTAAAAAIKTALDVQLGRFLRSLLATEAGIASGRTPESRAEAANTLQSFLMSFASRAASRERLHVFTTNYDRLVEHGCDVAGLRVVDRFVGALTPVFRSSRLELDLHYNPPGIRGEPRFMEGVIRITKLHGSIDWLLDSSEGRIRRRGIPFGADGNHSELPNAPADSAMIYPNPAKDVETIEYPYAELFRDFAAALCRPNTVLVTYGYGFGDDHINRVITDMLTIPSTHLVAIAYSADGRLERFLKRSGREAQISVMVGQHFADVRCLVEHYLPKPALDHITFRMTELLKRRPDGFLGNDQEQAGAAGPDGDIEQGDAGQ